VFTTFGNVVSSVAEGTTQVTRDITRFKLSQIRGLERVILNFFEIWGFDEGIYQQDSRLFDVVNGTLPNGYQMKERTRYTEELEQSLWKRHERRIHCVITFMSCSILDNKPMVDKLKYNLQVCASDCRMPPLLVVTGASIVGDQEEQNTLKKEIAIKFEVPEENISMMDNYTTEKEKSMRVDKMVLDVLVKAIENSKNFQRQWKSSLLEDLNVKESGTFAD